MRPLTLFALAALSSTAGAQRAATSGFPSGSPEKCSPVTSRESAAEWLERAAKRVLPTTPAGHVVRYRVDQDIAEWNRSERTYGPYVPDPSETNRWVDLATGVEGRIGANRTLRRDQFPGAVEAPDESYLGQDTALVAASILRSNGAVYRRMNPWLVLFDWRAHAADVRVVSRCVFREYSRIVLERGGERLYLTESDATPIKLERTEPDAVWGQVSAQYLWTSWWGVRGASGGLFPTATFRIFDGMTYTSSRVLDDRIEVVPADSAPRLDVRGAVQAGNALPGVTLLIAGPPDTVRVNDHTFLLVSRASTETITLQRDTVFVLDATTNEARARADSTWIAKLFPGQHPVVVVVSHAAGTDVGGVRSWVARGATIVSHASSEDFLRRIVERKWAQPDLLEKTRTTARLRFRPVTDSLRLAGGALVVHALRGRSTEGGLAVWMPADRYLWSGDYIANDPLSPTAFDVVQSMRTLGIRPESTAALHLKLSPWTEIERRIP